MSDETIRQDPELTKAADAFLEEIESKDAVAGEVNGVKLWNQWVLRLAFECGVAWQMGRTYPAARHISLEDFHLGDVPGE